MVTVNDKTVKRSVCSCGGVVTERSVTDKENEVFGCKNRKGCCVVAFECLACKTRFVFSLGETENDM